MKIEKIDKNFSTAANIGGAVWYDVKSAPFKTYGVYFDASAGLYARMPFDVAKSVSNGVGSLCRHTCGGRIRFGTDSPFVAVKITLDGVTGFPHMLFRAPRERLFTRNFQTVATDFSAP